MPGKYRSGNESKSFQPVYDEQPELIKKSCSHIVQEARQKSMWIYDPSNRTWYSPDDFQQQFERIVSGNEKFLAQVQIRDPSDGIVAGNQKLTDLQQKLEDFTNRVIAYFRNKKDESRKSK